MSYVVEPVLPACLPPRVGTPRGWCVVAVLIQLPGNPHLLGLESLTAHVQLQWYMPLRVKRCHNMRLSDKLTQAALTSNGCTCKTWGHVP